MPTKFISVRMFKFKCAWHNAVTYFSRKVATMTMVDDKQLEI